MILRGPVPLVGLLALVGCASEAGKESPRQALASNDSAMDAGTRVALRVDVIPSRLRDSDATTAPYRALPQTIEVQDVLVGDIRLGLITLARPERQAGTVTAYQVNPFVSALPGSDVPVQGTVWIRDPGSIQAYAATTDADGAFESWIVPGGHYRLEIVPDDPLLPIFAGPYTTRKPEAQRIDLGSGVPIYGFVRSAAGAMAGARVHVVDPEGATSAGAVADENGLYQLRVTPGTWTVVSEGRGIGQDPVLTLPAISVGEKGAHVDVTYPTALDPVLVQGRVVNPDGEAVRGTVVRFVAESLDGFGGLDARWITERPVGADSTFLGYLLPGTYTIEVLPPTVDASDDDYGPIRLSSERITTDAKLEVLELEHLRMIAGAVSGPRGRPIAGAQVTCSEIGFDGRFWTTFTDDEGALELALPRVPLACEVVPPGSERGLATRWVEHDPSERRRLEVTLEAGQVVRGRVATEAEGPEAYAVVEILDLDARRIGVGFTDERGDFEIRVDLEQARVSGQTP